MFLPVHILELLLQITGYLLFIFFAICWLWALRLLMMKEKNLLIKGILFFFLLFYSQLTPFLILFLYYTPARDFFRRRQYSIIGK